MKVYFGDVIFFWKEFCVWNEYFVDDRIFVFVCLMIDEIWFKIFYVDKVCSNVEICGIFWIGWYFFEEIDCLVIINKLF